MIKVNAPDGTFIEIKKDEIGIWMDSNKLLSQVTATMKEKLDQQ